ncbi:SWIB/MDM2 domain-containing protein [Rhodocollybia butyracea]|uniref:SWIB/MDM2 domain-containing protein n=1 Tax=Rhodocollybia butyracea TaxID=206335 RepID=A0A9P5UBZ5_9AGAR|nr:SWIB/MDM2 domain-containing protein [Rhodocollybia butyracea]
MTYDFDALEPLVRQILSAPGTDLTTISAKRVRRELLALDPSFSPEFLKENKNDVDAIITRVFGEVSNGQNGEASEGLGEPVTVSRSSFDPEGEEQGEVEEEEEEVKPKKTKKTSKKELSDAELARQLSSEINGRSRRNTGKGTLRKSKSKKKSATTIDSDGSESGEEGGKKTRKKRAGGGAAKGGFAKEFTLSPPLAALLQIDKLSRPQVVKQLWVYIKGNERQNPANKREILCDDGLRAVFNVDKIDMFKMNKVLGQHLHEE